MNRASTPLIASQSNSLEGGASFSLSNRLIRAAWRVCWFLLCSWTPPRAHGWRRAILRLFGADMEGLCDVRGSARVWLPKNLVMKHRAILAEGVICYNMDKVTIGRGAIVSQRAHLCCGSHDIESQQFQLITKPIYVGDGVWIASEAFIGPGCTIESGAVVGARGVAFGSLISNGVYAGNPAKLIRMRSQDARGNC